MSFLSSKLDEILNELYELNNYINTVQGKEAIERYRKEFRFNRKNIKIKGILANYENSRKFIKFEDLFPTIYSDFYGNNPSYKNIVVIIEENGDTKEYIIEKPIRRKDPFFEPLSERTKLPETSFLKYNNTTIDKKIIEARPYIKIETLYRYISKEKPIYLEIPTVLLVKPLELFRELSHILYTSKPYIQNHPYVTKIYFGTHKTFKKTVNIDLPYLTTLILSELVEQTGFSYIFKGKLNKIDYTDLKSNLFYTQQYTTKISELEERLYQVTEEIFRFLAMYGFIPTDIGFEQIGFSRGELRFIDIGSGFDVMTKKGINYNLPNLIKYFIESFINSPYLNICKVDYLSREIICKGNITSNKESKDTLIGILYKVLNKNNVKTIIEKNLDENNIEKINSILKTSLNIYRNIYKITSGAGI